MLLGIHEDTGSLTYPGATAYDAEAVAFLMATGADMEVVNQFLARTLEPEQRALLEQLTGLARGVGHQRPAGRRRRRRRSDEYVDSASVVTHYLSRTWATAWRSRSCACPTACRSWLAADSPRSTSGR